MHMTDYTTYCVICQNIINTEINFGLFKKLYSGLFSESSTFSIIHLVLCTFYSTLFANEGQVYLQKL